MRPVDRLRNGRRLVLFAGDAIIFAAVLILAFFLRTPGSFDLSVVGPFFPIWVCLVVSAYAAGLYEIRVVRDFVALVGGLLGSALACGLFAVAYFYVFASYLKFAPKFTLFVVVLGAHAGMFAWRRVVLLATGFNLVDLKILVLGDEGYNGDLRDSLHDHTGAQFRLVDHIADDVDLVVVDSGWTDRHPQEARATLMMAIANLTPIISITDFHEAAFGRVSPQHANDLTWALDYVLPRSGSLYFKTKRFYDFVCALALFLPLLPLMLVIAALIRLIDGHPPLYAQTRAGYLGRHFRLWKFRTMRQDAETHGPFLQRVDEGNSRVTPLGSILRRLRIDELPQLWNVICGNMSLVGPRPEWVKEVEILERLVPSYSLRYLVPPGITGWAQVYYRATDNAQDSIEKHHYDLYYLKHFSLALDLSILLKTAKRILLRDRRVISVPTPTPPSRAVQSERLDIACIVDRG